MSTARGVFVRAEGTVEGFKGRQECKDQSPRQNDGESVCEASEVVDPIEANTIIATQSL